MVLEWTLGLKRLAYSSVSLHLTDLKGTWETQNHQTFCVSLVLVSFTLRPLQIDYRRAALRKK